MGLIRRGLVIDWSRLGRGIFLIDVNRLLTGRYWFRGGMGLIRRGLMIDWSRLGRGIFLMDVNQLLSGRCWFRGCESGRRGKFVDWWKVNRRDR